MDKSNTPKSKITNEQVEERQRAKWNGKVNLFKMKQTTITIKHIIQKDLATTNTFKYNIYGHTTKTYKTHIHVHGHQT